jgi:glucose/mannose transport system substrate-binding protein
MTHGSPPDILQLNGGQDLTSWLRSSTMRDKLESVDFLFSSEKLYRCFPQDVLDLITHRGRTYAVPIGIHRTNTLYANRTVFERHGIAIPTTLEEMRLASKALHRAGITPIALGAQSPWSWTMWAFEGILASQCGGAFYKDYFAGKKDRNAPELRHALVTLRSYLPWVHPDSPRFAWADALAKVCQGEVAMTITGDWARGDLRWRGNGIGDEIVEVPMPGAHETFVFALDVFGLAKGAPHAGSAIDILRAVASVEGQGAFNPIKGSIPARWDTPPSLGSLEMARRRAQFQDGLRVPSLACMAPGAFTLALEHAMVRFAGSGDVDVVLDALRTHYDLLGSC